jgi:hypothetical protein
VDRLGEWASASFDVGRGNDIEVWKELHWPDRAIRWLERGSQGMRLPMDGDLERGRRPSMLQ